MKETTLAGSKFIDLYELLQVEMTADAETLRKRIQQLYLEAQQNLDHRNPEKRLRFQQLHEVYVPQARHLLLNPARRVEYDRYLASYRNGVAPTESDAASSQAVEEHHAGLPALTPDAEEQKLAAERDAMWKKWQTEHEAELAQSRAAQKAAEVALAKQKTRSRGLLWISVATIVFMGIGVYSYLNRKEVETEAAIAVQVKQIAGKIKPANLASNPEMTQKDEVSGAPANWGELWIGRGKLAASYDTRIFHSAPASLCLGSIQSAVGDVEGQVAQKIPVKPGLRLRFRGYLKTAGQALTLVAIQPYGTKAQGPIGFLQVGSGVNNSAWTPISEEVVIPPGTQAASVVMLIKGKGRAWLDDIEVTEVKSK